MDADLLFEPREAAQFVHFIPQMGVLLVQLLQIFGQAGEPFAQHWRRRAESLERSGLNRRIGNSSRRVGHRRSVHPRGHGRFGWLLVGEKLAGFDETLRAERLAHFLSAFKAVDAPRRVLPVA